MTKIDEKFVFEPTAFDYVNQKAEVVIVGITPGNSQLDGSREGMSPREIKRKFAFAGSMRPNLVKMLDYIGVNGRLGINSCKSLWEEDFDKVDMTSLLKEATYELKKDGSKMMFKDVKKIAKSEKLTRMLEEGFVKDCSNYENWVLYVACGPGVYDVLKKLEEEGKIKGFVAGIAHPSGANLGRILCYLGKTEPKDLSYQWCVDKAKETKRLVTFLDMHKFHWDSSTVSATMDNKKYILCYEDGSETGSYITKKHDLTHGSEELFDARIFSEEEMENIRKEIDEDDYMIWNISWDSEPFLIVLAGAAANEYLLNDDEYLDDEGTDVISNYIKGNYKDVMDSLIEKCSGGTLGNLVESIIEQIDFSDLNDVDKQSRWCCHQD